MVVEPRIPRIYPWGVSKPKTEFLQEKERREEENLTRAGWADAEKNFCRDGHPSRWEVYAMRLDVRRHLLHPRRKKNASFIWKNKKFHMENGDSGVMES